MLLVFGLLLGLTALLLAARERRSYRARDEADDLFIYSRARLIRRLVGLAVLAGVGVTLAVWDVAPPGDPGTASVLLALLLIEVLALIVIAVLDLRETSSTARFAGPDRRDR